MATRQRPGRRQGSPPSAAETQDRRAGRAIELFQLTFLEVAAVELPLPDFALKGGGNLRFFLRSRRRSRDLDLDYLGHRFDGFAERVDRVFASRALGELLRARGLTLADPRRSKDTPTVKRWKLSLAASGMEEAASKIEFSARGRGADPIFEQLDESLARRVRSRPVRLQHYAPAPTVEQKVRALAQRRQTEPRDVFDLDHLFREYPEALAQARLDPTATRAAVANALELRYEDYVALVLEYLEEEFVPLYGTEDAWNDMVLRVTTRLEERLREQRR